MGFSFSPLSSGKFLGLALDGEGRGEMLTSGMPTYSWRRPVSLKDFAPSPNLDPSILLETVTVVQYYWLDPIIFQNGARRWELGFWTSERGADGDFLFIMRGLCKGLQTLREYEVKLKEWGID